jgi:butyryl-CoA dehydrogenase
VDFSLPADDAAALAQFRKLCAQNIAPRAANTDRGETFPHDNYRLLANAGYLGMGHAATHGGSEVSPALSVLMQEALGAACASTFLSAGASCGLFAMPLSLFGSDEQQTRHLPALLRGERIGCFGLTEAHAGSDVQALKTRADKRDGAWFLTGEKAWITNAPCADVALVFARADEGISLFLVERGTPGFTQGPPLRKLGFRGSPTGALIFDDARAELVGEPGMGFVMAMQTLELGRIGMAALSVGIARAALSEGVAYVKTRTAFGKPLAKFQDVQFTLADLATDIELARTLTIRAAEEKRRAGEARTLASMAKLFASELATRATDAVLTLHGANGYSEEFPIARLVRDARLCPIGEGASAVQRMLIARALLE